MYTSTIPYRIEHSFHPAVIGAYVQNEQRGTSKSHRVLVLETDSADDTKLSFHDTLMDLLADLPSIQHEVEEKVGRLERVDIKLM